MKRAEKNFICVIPAREKSKRFPSKLIKYLDRFPVIFYVVLACAKSKAKNVFVATDSPKIKKEIEKSLQKSKIPKKLKDKIKIKIVKGRKIKSGTDRVAELVKRELKSKSTEIIVNVQGDEPLITPEIINKVAHALAKDKNADIATYGFISQEKNEIENPNRVKIAVSEKGNYALYFSRSPIPYGAKKFIIHTGIYAFREKSLIRFASLKPTENEKTEKLEQLRALDNGMKIKMVIGKKKLLPIDTPQDLQKLKKIIRKNKI